MKLLAQCFIISTAVFQIFTQESTKAPKRKYHGRKGLLRMSKEELELLRSDVHYSFFNHPKQDIPEHFDARERWPECESIREIQDQGHCGSCWAVATASALNDRLCIGSNGTNKRNISAEDLLTCCLYCTDRNRLSENVCDRGGYEELAAKYMVKQGVVTGATNAPIGCKPCSELTLIGFAPSCVRQCTNHNYAVRYHQDRTYIRGYRYGHRAVEQTQLEILQFGPVTAGIALTNASMTILGDPSFKGVYTGPSGIPDTDHLVKIIGWGTEEGVPYWLIANSWGKDWGGNGGFFKVKRGENLLECEDMVVGLKTEYEPEEEGEGGYKSGVKISSDLVVVLWSVLCLQCFI